MSYMHAIYISLIHESSKLLKQQQSRNKQMNETIAHGVLNQLQCYDIHQRAI